MRISTLIISLTLALLASPATAGKKAGVTMPDTLTMGGKTLTLNGMGLREATFLKVDVYVAGLYLEHVSSDPAQIVNTDDAKVLVLRFVRDVDRGDITKAWSDGFKKNSPVALAGLQPNIDQLNSWMPAFNDGDTLVFSYAPGDGVAVMVNTTRKGVIKGADFARSLFSIWLGPKPPTGALKKGLLGKHPLRPVSS